MKIAWVMTTVSAVVCTAASMVLFGQYALWTKLYNDEVEQRAKYQSFDATFNERQFIKNTLQNQLELQRKTVSEMEGEREKATLVEKQKAADLDFCKGDRKKKDEALAVAQKEQADTEVKVSKEGEAWEAEITSLKKVKEQPSKVCLYIKKDTLGAKLCTAEAARPAPAEPRPAEPAPAA